jgi:hypothetical protein
VRHAVDASDTILNMNPNVLGSTVHMMLEIAERIAEIMLPATPVADSHMAVARRKVMEYLMTREQNTFKAAATPKTLLEGLTTNGGMPNCSAQLIEVDRLGRLIEIEKSTASLSNQAKDYFSRANEYRFDTKAIAQSAWAELNLSDPANWKEVSFDMQVFAYSNVGSGQKFHSHFGNGTFVPVDDDDDSSVAASLASSDSAGSGEIGDGSNVDDVDDHSSDGTSDGSWHWAVEDFEEYQYFEDSDVSDSDSDSESDTTDSNTELDVDTDDEDEEGENEEEGGNDCDGDYFSELQEQSDEKFCGEPHHSAYQGTFTNFKVKLRQTFGLVEARGEATKRVLEQGAARNEDEDEDGDENAERAVLAKSISMARESIASGRVAFQDSRNLNMREYTVFLVGFAISDDDWSRSPGWARRPDGDMYGKRYVSTYKRDIAEIFDQGARNSSDKKGPTAILEVLEEKYPGLYRYPGEHDISTIITSLMQKSGDGEQLEREKQVPVEIEEQLRGLMARHPTWTGKYICDAFETEAGDHQIPANYYRPKAMKRVGALRSQAKKKEISTLTFRGRFLPWNDENTHGQ